jgi:hypothetical protein
VKHYARQNGALIFQAEIQMPPGGWPKVGEFSLNGDPGKSRFQDVFQLAGKV